MHWHLILFIISLCIFLFLVVSVKLTVRKDKNGEIIDRCTIPIIYLILYSIILFIPIANIVVIVVSSFVYIFARCECGALEYYELSNKGLPGIWGKSL